MKLNRTLFMLIAPLLALAPANARDEVIAPVIPGVDANAWIVPFPTGPADTFVRKGVHSGSLVTRAQCDGAGQRERGRFVYVEAMGRGACIRYYLSGDAFPQNAAAVYLPGDKGGFRANWRSGRYQMVPEELLPRDGQPAKPAQQPDMARKLGDPDRNQALARAVANRLRMPAIILARQGTDGSSGWVALKRTRWETAITNAALDAIKARHGIEKLHVVGQSGGGHLVGALAALRTDISCAVAGSAPLAINPRSFYLSQKIPEFQRFFNPAEHAAAIAGKPGLRLMLVTDGRDQRVFVEAQAQFVRAMARGGMQVPQHFVTAGDAQSHGVTLYSLAALRACIAGKSDDEIGLELALMSAKMIQQRVQSAQARRAKEEQAPEGGSKELSKELSKDLGPDEPVGAAPAKP